MINRRKCTAITDGQVIKLTNKGLDFPTLITVQYAVDNVYYQVTESIKLKSYKIKIGFLPIGQKKVPVMGETSVGTMTKVNYNPANPTEAFITYNQGRINV